MSLYGLNACAESAPEVSRHNEPQVSPQEFDCGCVTVCFATDRDFLLHEEPFEMRKVVACLTSKCECPATEGTVMNVGDVFTYEGPVWDFDAEHGETFDRPADVMIAKVMKDWYVVTMVRYPTEPHKYLIARVMLDAPTEVFQAGYEAAIEDMRNGTIPLWVVGLIDEHEFMGQEPDSHGDYLRGPFTDLDAARAVARTMSIDPDEAVIVPVRP